jgi:hypothetical protein
MIDHAVIFCGIVKNVGEKARSNIDLVLRTGQQFRKFKCVVYENNSTDSTKDILKTYAGNSAVKILSEDLPPESFKKENSVLWAYTDVTGSDHPCRMELISNARNKLLEEINKPDYSEYTYCIMIDLDSNGWDINGIVDSFRRCDEWDAVFATSRPYYDYYALRTAALPFGPELLGDSFWRALPSIRPQGPLVPVYSAFNGIGIYKKSLLEAHRYDFQVDDEMKIFYRKWLSTNSINAAQKALIENPCAKFPISWKDEEGAIVWKSNSGYKGAVVCEHLPLNLALVNRGCRLFINPAMVYNR